MTPLTSSFRSQILLLVLVLSLGCRGDDGLSTEGPGFGGSGAASGAGGTGGNGPSDASNTFYVDRAPDLTPDSPAVVPVPVPLPPDAALVRDTPPPSPDAALSPQPDAVSTALDRPPVPPSSPLPDAAPPPPPDTAPPPPDPNAIVPTTCEQIPCQQLFVAALDCNTDGQVCQSQQTAQDPVARTNYCHASGIRKLSSTTFSGDRYMTTMRVNRADGSQCYTLEMSGSAAGDVETQVWRAPTGAVLMTGSWTKSADRLLLSCNGLSYDTREIGCPGLDGEPSIVMCPAGTCPD